MSDTKHTIFISYRRDDNSVFVERIRDWFIHRYEREHVFMDFDSIPPFVNFADFIREKVQESDALIAVIGPEWLNLLKKKAESGDEDYVRIEIGLALQMGKLVAPICIMGATIPRRIELPDDLRPMLDYNAAHLNSGHAFYDDIERIVEAVEREVDKHRARDYFERGLARELKDVDGKLLDYTEAIRLDPYYAEAYARRCGIYNIKREHDKALSDANIALSLDRRNVTAYFNRGSTHYGKRDRNGAIADFTEVIRLNPQYVDAYYNRGVAHKYNRDWRGAIEDFEKFLDLGGGTKDGRKTKVEKWRIDLRRKL